MPDLKILSVRETYWDETALACQQTTGYGPVKNATIRISINPKSQIVIQKFNHGMQVVSAVAFDDFDINGMIEYLQEVKQHLSEQKLIDKLTGK